MKQLSGGILITVLIILLFLIGCNPESPPEEEQAASSEELVVDESLNDLKEIETIEQEQDTDFSELEYLEE